MFKKILIVLTLFFTNYIISQSSTLSGATGFCSDTGLTFNNTFGNGDVAEAGPNYGCLADQPNPAWYFIRIDAPGNLSLQISQIGTVAPNIGDPIDVDFIAWGPFREAELVAIRALDYSYLTTPNQVGCSFSPAAVENLNIPGTLTGQYYVILITNYDDIEGEISMAETNPGAPGTGSTDCSIVVGELGADQEVCFGTNVSLDATPTTGTVDTYEWLVDTSDGTGFNTIVGETNAVLNITNNLSGIYKAIVTDTDGIQGEDEVTITFFEVPVANTTLIPDVCDTDRDGFNTFNFDIDATPQVLLAQSTTDFEVLYFTSMPAAIANVAGTNIIGAYTNATAFTTETIYARIHNISRPECSNITSFTISVRDVATPNQPTEYRECDDIASGSDTDTITNNFLLNTKDSEILGLANSSLQFNVSYHTTLLGAQTDNATDAIDKTINYPVTVSQTVYVRVENVDNPNCAVVSDDTAGSAFTPFELIVDPLPIVNNPAELIQCHNNPDLDTNVNLTLARINVSPNYVANGETFEYYQTEADAIAGTPQIADELRYPIIGSGQAWVRVISNQNCYRISRIDITVNFSADLAYDEVFTECDDFLDIDGNDTATNSDTDGIATFDFSRTEDEIKAFFPVSSRPDLDVFYYESESDRTSSINDINSDIANHRNNNDPAFASNQTIYVKIVNNTNNGCSGTANIFLQVDTVPLANNLAQPLSFCDDFDSGSSNDGENIGINLRSTVTDILGPTQTEADFIVTYHNSQADATSGAAAITTDTNFRNTAPAGFVPGTVSRQTIFVRVEDRTKVPACFNDHISFDIEITPLPELQNTIAPIDVCDVPTTTDSDPRNRLAQNIDITIRNTDILNGRDLTIFSIWFYKSYADALTDTDRIDAADLLNYENDPANTTIPANINSDDPGIETLFFTINNANTTCTSEPFTLDVHIYPEPNIPVNITNYVDCDNDNNGLGNDTDGILENIAFSSKITEILTFYSVAEQSNFTVSFHRDLADAQSGSDPLDTNAYENEVNNQTIYVRVVNNITTCVYDDLSFQIIVNPLPTYDPLDLSQVACLNNLPLTLQVDNPLTAYNYSWVENQTGTEISTAQSVDVRAGGTYTLTVTDRVTGCARIEQFDVIESEAATITDDNIFVVDDTSDISGNSFSITIDPTGLGVGDYEYALLNEQGAFVRSYQDDLIFDQLTGGFYTLLVRDKNGCDINQIPASIEVPVVEFPKFFTPNGDGANDTWTIKGANINYYPSSEIYVYNRFGKVVAKVDLANQGWNGTYNGKRLPSDDYWFSIKLVPFDTTKKVISKTGNFSLLRK